MFITEQFKSDIIPLKEDKNTAKKRYAYIDALKVLSAFLVVFYHYAFYSIDYGFSQNSFYYPNINRVVMSFAACSVPLFFMVNGALLFSKHRTWKSSFYKAGKLLFIVVSLKFLKFPSWFFITLSILYILYPFFLYLFEKKRIFVYFIVLLGFLFPFVYNEFTVILKLFSDKNLSITGAKTMYSIVYFLLGGILFDKNAVRIWKSVIISVAGMAFLTFDCIVLTNYGNKMADGVNGAFPTIGALLLSFGIFELTKANKHITKIRLPAIISNGILSVYLFHQLLIRFFAILFGYPENIFIAFAGTAAICLICCFIGGIIRKIPVICFFSKI